MFIPVGDENRRGSATPYVVYSIIAINIIVFVYQLYLERSYGTQALKRFIYDFGAVPSQIFGEYSKPIGLFTSIFLHADIMHLFGNMLFLWIFADNIEDVLGSGKFLLFYLLCGTIAGLASMLARTGSLASNIPGIGASGAIAGVMGAYFTMFPYNRIRTFYWFFFFWAGVVDIAAFWYLGIWVLLQFVLQSLSSAVGGVDYIAHLAGFIAGVILILIFPKRQLVIQECKRQFKIS